MYMYVGKVGSVRVASLSRRPRGPIVMIYAQMTQDSQLCRCCDCRMYDSRSCYLRRLNVRLIIFFSFPSLVQKRSGVQVKGEKEERANRVWASMKKKKRKKEKSKLTQSNPNYRMTADEGPGYNCSSVVYSKNGTLR